MDGRILTVVPVEWLNTGGVQIRGEGERNVKSEKKKSRMQMHSGFLANPVSLERPEREPVIWAKKKSLERDMRPDSVWWRRRWDSNPRAYL